MIFVCLFRIERSLINTKGCCFSSFEVHSLLLAWAEICSQNVFCKAKHTQTFEKPAFGLPSHLHNCQQLPQTRLGSSCLGSRDMCSGSGSITASRDDLYFCETVNSNSYNPYPRIWKVLLLKAFKNLLKESWVLK